MKINKTVAKIGEKEISVKAFKIELHRFSIVLCCLTNEGKLPQMIVFKCKFKSEKRSQNFIKEKI